jgi:hypothetical protein
MAYLGLAALAIYAVLAAPFFAAAQQARNVPRIGYLTGLRPNPRGGG